MKSKIHQNTKEREQFELSEEDRAKEREDRAKEDRSFWARLDSLREEYAVMRQRGEFDEIRGTETGRITSRQSLNIILIPID